MARNDRCKRQPVEDTVCLTHVPGMGDPPKRRGRRNLNGHLLLLPGGGVQGTAVGHGERPSPLLTPPPTGRVRVSLAGT